MTSTSPAAEAERQTIARLRAAGCVFAEDEARLLHDASTSPVHLTAMVERRVAGEPLEHVLGWVEFCGLRIAVDPGVFVPRRRTEHLVGEAAGCGFRGAVVVDLCCGSGAIGVAVAAILDDAELYATDVDPVAVECARRNVDAVGGEVYEGDLDAPLPTGLRGRVDLLVANVPYVPTADLTTMPPEARVHEPRVALDGGADGLDVLRRVAPTAATWLAPGGCLVVETGERQAPSATDIVVRAGLVPRVSESTELAATVLVGTKPTDGRSVSDAPSCSRRPATSPRTQRSTRRPSTTDEGGADPRDSTAGRRYAEQGSTMEPGTPRAGRRRAE